MQGPCNPTPDLSSHTLPDIALDVLAKFDAMHAAVREAYEGYRFHEVAGLLYDFFWGDYCDWFVEAAKPVLNGTDAATKAAILSVMDTVLSGFLRLLHPLMPHVTEELWARLGFRAPLSASASGKRAEFLLYTTPPEERLLSLLPMQSQAHNRASPPSTERSMPHATSARSSSCLPSSRSACSLCQRKPCLLRRSPSSDRSPEPPR